MRLIADSGSTKTHWVLVRMNEDNMSFYTEGINPYFMDSDTIVELVNKCFVNTDISEVEDIYFYGAGCSTVEKCSIVSTALSTIFQDADISVYSDVLASAHALFGKKQGVACILGTGSNAVVYDGDAFSSKVQSLGYLLGDEGSGSYIGKQILQSYLRKEMPANLSNSFSSEYKIDVANILEHLYKRAFPNRYIASFAAFASVHPQDDFILSIIRSSFKDFINYQLSVLKFEKSIPIGFVGSIAYHFKDILKVEIERNGYVLGTVLKEPMNNLVEMYSTSD